MAAQAPRLSESPSCAPPSHTAPARRRNARHGATHAELRGARKMPARTECVCEAPEGERHRHLGLLCRSQRAHLLPSPAFVCICAAGRSGARGWGRAGSKRGLSSHPSVADKLPLCRRHRDHLRVSRLVQRQQESKRVVPESCAAPVLLQEDRQLSNPNGSTIKGVEGRADVMASSALDCAL